MNVPPERITVKRRRDEEPIGALYLPPKRYQCSGLWKLAGREHDDPTYGESVASHEPHTNLKPTASNSPKIPIVRTTQSCEDLPKEMEDVSHKPVAPLSPDQILDTPIITRPVKEKKKIQEATSEPRKFHLTKTPFQASSPYTVPRTPAERHRKKRKTELAVFVETGKVPKARSIRRDNEISEAMSSQSGDDDNMEPARPEIIRRRPNASTAERKWRADNWDKRTEPRVPSKQGLKKASYAIQPSHEWDYESPELAEDLRRIALEETQSQEGQLRDVGKFHQLKTPPKPPKPRRSLYSSSVGDGVKDDVMAGIVTQDDADYIFDTYIRSDAQPPGITDPTDAFLDSLHGLDRSSMGMIVIEDSEEELWETFIEEFDSEPDFNSEEEDENAEDFYGNDYPEDEVNSDDEFGRGAYNYRNGASDDEEFDADEPSSSDDETQMRSSLGTRYNQGNTEQ